jgi:hypothetical protein
MKLLSKYEDYEPKSNIDMSDIPYANIVMGVLENETIEKIQKHLGGTPWNETPFDVWQRVFDACQKYKGESYGIRSTSRLQ